MNRYSGFSVLIVDDHPGNLLALRSLIKRYMDVQVLEAGSGPAAIELAVEHHDLDLIILDVQMPEMDGFETASMLKVRKRTRDIPIIFLTAAFKAREFQQKGYALGAADYLLKPIDDNQLINKISTYFRLIEKERDLNRKLEARVVERTAELRHTQEYLAGIIDNMGEALLVLTPEGIIKSANPAAAALLGYPATELAGMSIGDVFEEEEPETAKAFMGTWLEALIRAGTLPSIEARFIARDDRRVPILFSRAALVDTKGTITDIICIAKDMSGYTRVDN